jgi:hypothetical protein
LATLTLIASLALPRKTNIHGKNSKKTVLRPAALEFHHRDPKEKEFQISRLTTVIMTEDVRQELDKCDLLCSVCHKEFHYYEEEGEEDGRKR